MLLHRVLVGWLGLHWANTVDAARKRLRKGLRSASLMMRRSWHRAWLLEIVFFFFASSFFAILWWRSAMAATPVSQYIQATWAVLPVLAVTNALPMLGVGAFLSRYSVSDKPSETLAALSRLVEEDFERINGHPRANPFQRYYVYRNVLRRAKTASFSFWEGEETLFTPRPYWDGVWFHGSDSYLRTKEVDWDILYPVHELLFCAITLLRVVTAFRLSGAFSIDGGPFSGSQGSTGFIKNFATIRHLIQDPLKVVNIRDARAIMNFAVASVHYMTEELRNHQEETVRNERQETVFIHFMCDYLIWLNYFHSKLLICRIATARRRIDIKKLQPYFTKIGEGIQGVHKGAVTLRTANLVRMGIAERIHQVRLGTIFPILTTAAALLIYICLQPLAYGQFDPWYARTVAGAAYVLAATSIGMNLAFGVWLLLPALQAEARDLVYRG